MSKKNFSIIIATYNTGKYLMKAIESVLNQTLDFMLNAEIIIIDDGSIDNTHEICLEYVKKFPDNIRYFYQNNAGVSNARNFGIMKSNGRWVSFLDADDYYSNNVFFEMKKFILEYGILVDVIAMPIYFFGDRIGAHMQNGKFEHDAIIDVTKEPNKFVMQTGSTFILKETLKNLKFPINQKYAEDASLLIDIISLKKKYGIITKAYYNYRKRKNSTLQTNSDDYGYWFDFFKLYGIPKLKKYYDYGEYYDYVQNVMMYDAQWRIKENYCFHNQTNREEYKKILIDFIQFIDIDIIENQKYLSNIQKNFLIRLKKELKWIEHKDIYNFACIKEVKIVVDSCQIDENKIVVSGYVDTIANIEKVILRYRKDEYYNLSMDNRNECVTGIPIYTISNFRFEISKDKIIEYMELEFICNDEKVNNVLFLDSCIINSKIRNGSIIFFSGKSKYFLGFNHVSKKFYISKYNLLKMLIKEFRVVKELRKRKNFEYNVIIFIRIMRRIFQVDFFIIKFAKENFIQFFSKYEINSIYSYISDVFYH